jgi:hypothetical protein
MLKRYNEIRHVFSEVDILPLSTYDEREIALLIEHFRCFHEATLKLQEDKTNLLDAHTIFSVLIYDVVNNDYWTVG